MLEEGDMFRGNLTFETFFGHLMFSFLYFFWRGVRLYEEVSELLVRKLLPRTQKGSGFFKEAPPAAFSTGRGSFLEEN